VKGNRQEKRNQQKNRNGLAKTKLKQLPKATTKSGGNNKQTNKQINK
jgi:hypothetical protein